jgi:plasmid maintenance system antidote protein VapI
MNRRLKAKIVENFESQANFAQVIKTDETIISRVVRGRRILPVETQQKWADTLGCKRKDIFED